MASGKGPAGRLVAAFAILVVLLIVVALVVDPFGWFGPSKQELEQADLSRLVLCDFTGEQVTAIEIVKPDDERFVLAKEGDTWLVESGESRYEANMERVDKLLSDIPGLRSMGLVSDKLEKHSTFEVDEETGIGVNVHTGGAEPAVRLVAGKSAPGYQNSYVRLADEEAVYRASRNLKILVGFTFTDYRSRTPWSFEPLTAEAVTVAPVEGKTDPLSFPRQDGLWKTPSGGNANQNLLTELVHELSQLSINEFVDEPEEETVRLEGIEPQLVVSTAQGDFKLILGAEDGSYRYVKDQRGSAYKVSEYNLSFYLELAFDELLLDDTATEAVEPDEGVADGLPSDVEEQVE